MLGPTAVAGAGWGGYETYAVLPEVNATCAELVPAGKTLSGY
ncbi:hypothetical protein [Streptomyces mesophilus]